MAIRLPPPEPVEGDPFGLHDPLTMGDLIRIENALHEGTVAGAERDRLQAIYDSEAAPLKELGQKMAAIATAAMPKIDFAAFSPKIEMTKMFPALSGIGSLMDAPKFKALGAVTGGLSKFDTAAMFPGLVRFDDLIDKSTLKAFSAFTANVPKLDFPKYEVPGLKAFGEEVLASAMPKVDLSAQSALSEGVEALRRSSAYDVPPLFIDTRPARMEELAELQVTTLEDVCGSLDKLTDAVVASEERAEKRYREQQRSSRIQFWTIVAVTVLVGILGVVAAFVAG